MSGQQDVTSRDPFEDSNKRPAVGSAQPARKKKSIVNRNVTLYGGFKSARRQHASAGFQHDQRRSSAKSKSTRPSPPKSLDGEKFLSLPPGIMTRVCRFLHPLDLLILARTSKKLRAMFMTKGSKPHWNATRHYTGMPDWRTVAFPQATAMLYESSCQGLSCNDQSTVLAFYVCRRYCLKCARENLLDLEEVSQQFPSVPEDLVKHLPWTARRTSPPDTDISTGRFYLKADVLELRQRLDSLEPLNDESRGQFRRELSAFRKERNTSTTEMNKWRGRCSRLVQGRLNERWSIVADVMKTRWGWKPTQYDQLGPRLSQIVDYLVEVPALSEETWDRVRSDLEWAIREEATIHDRYTDRGVRRFSLSHGK